MLIKTLSGLSAIGFLIVLYLVFFWLPIEVNQGFAQKIMYIHVPAVWTAFIAVFVAFLASVGYLWKREEKFDRVALSAVEIGEILVAITLLTGSIWGRPTWNTYWSWDARLTTTLILFLIFVGYLLLRKFMDYGDTQMKSAAIIAILGFLDIIPIHLSVTWWRTLHQTSTFFTTKKNTISFDLWIVTFISFGVFLLLFVTLLIARTKLEKEKRDLQRLIAEEV